MANVAPTVAAAAAAAAATTSSSSASDATDLATGIIVVIVICCVLVAFIAGLIWFCVRRRRTKKRRAALLATAQQNAENARLSQQQMNVQYPPQDSTYQGQPPPQPQPQLNEYMTEMPAYPPPLGQTTVEKNGEERYEVWSPPPQANEMYSPPASAEMPTGAPLSSELDGSYGSLPTGPNNDVSSPMLRKEHEQAYSRSWKAAGEGA